MENNLLTYDESFCLRLLALIDAAQRTGVAVIAEFMPEIRAETEMYDA